VVHEDLQGRSAILLDISRDAPKLLFGRDDEVISKVDPCTSLGNAHDFIKNLLVGAGRHQVRNHACDAALGRRSRLAISDIGDPRPRDVFSVTQVEMRIDDARQNDEPGRIDDTLCLHSAVRLQNGGNQAIAHSDIDSSATRSGQHWNSSRDQQIQYHADFLCASALRAAESALKSSALGKARMASNIATVSAGVALRPRLARNFAKMSS